MPITSHSFYARLNMGDSQIPYDLLESIRHRLNQVYVSLRKLADQIRYHPTGKIRLPNYAHFVNQFQVLITQLNSIANTLHQDADVLSLTNVYPLPLFPTSQQEGLLTTLLRKKVLPEVETWIDEAMKVPDDYNEEYAQWCASKVLELREDALFFGFNTLEELEEMETEDGKRKQEAIKAKEKERDANVAEITNGKLAMLPNDALKFMCTGFLE